MVKSARLTIISAGDLLNVFNVLPLSFTALPVKYLYTTFLSGHGQGYSILEGLPPSSCSGVNTKGIPTHSQ